MTVRRDARGREGTRIISALESAWQTIQSHHPGVPHVVCVTGTGAGRRGTRLTLGHHRADAWVEAEMTGRNPELFVAGETVAQGGDLVIETMLHEGAHAVAAARGIKDTSSAGRWHNKKFAALAEELGLKAPSRTAPTIGYSECLLTPATRRRYSTVIRRLDEAGLPYLPGGPLSDNSSEEAIEEGSEPEGGGSAGKTGGKRSVVACSCKPARRFRLTPAIIKQGPILCGVCEREFEVEAPPGAEDGHPAGTRQPGPARVADRPEPKYNGYVPRTPDVTTEPSETAPLSHPALP